MSVVAKDKDEDTYIGLKFPLDHGRDGFFSRKQGKFFGNSFTKHSFARIRITRYFRDNNLRDIRNNNFLRLVV